VGRRRWGHVAATISALAALVAAVVFTGTLALYERAFGGGTAADVPVPDVSAERPLLIVVRGWLVDPASRATTDPLYLFPTGVNRLLEERGLPAMDFVQYDWSRVPQDLLATAPAFVEFARAVADAAAATGRCVNFVGHSAGAMLVYRAAASGVPMGFMGTIGLPTPTAGRPASVTEWDNFYTTGYVGDLPGWLWGARDGADQNLDLGVAHRDMWKSEDLARAAADGIEKAWSSCEPSRETGG
jgi:hypothetical protein